MRLFVMVGAVSVVIGRGTNLALATGLRRRVFHRRSRHQMGLTIRDDGGSTRPNAWLFCNRLALIAIILGCFTGRIFRAIRLGDRRWELAGKLLMDMRIVRGGRRAGARLFRRGAAGRHGIKLHRKLREAGGGDVGRKLLTRPRRRKIGIQRR